MNREEAMNNLWTKSGRTADPLLIHMLRPPSGVSTPIQEPCQRVDPSGHFEVIPLPASSY